MTESVKVIDQKPKCYVLELLNVKYTVVSQNLFLNLDNFETLLQLEGQLIAHARNELQSGNNPKGLDINQTVFNYTIEKSVTKFRHVPTDTSLGFERETGVGHFIIKLVCGPVSGRNMISTGIRVDKMHIINRDIPRFDDFIGEDIMDQDLMDENTVEKLISDISLQFPK